MLDCRPRGDLKSLEWRATKEHEACCEQKSHCTEMETVYHSPTPIKVNGNFIGRLQWVTPANPCGVSGVVAFHDRNDSTVSMTRRTTFISLFLLTRNLRGYPSGYFFAIVSSSFA